MTQPEKLPLKKTKTFKALVLCVYVYSCVQLEPFENALELNIGNDVQAEESQLEIIIKEKLSRLILAIFD